MKKQDIVKNKINENNYKLEKVNHNIKLFKEECKYLDDPRISEKTTYKIWDIVTVTFLASLANCNDWEEIHQFAILKYDWLRSFLQLTGGIPCAKTYERVISMIKPTQLEHLVTYFVQNIHKSFSLDIDIISIDGKVNTSSGRKATIDQEEIKNLNVLNVYSKNEQMCIYSEQIEDKSNEIPAVYKVLDLINIKNAIVTWDALNTQKDNVAKVVANKGDYVVALKSNHETFYNEVCLYFNDDMLNIMRSGAKGVYGMHYEKRGRNVAKYEYFQTEDIKWFHDRKDWAGLKSIGVVVKTSDVDIQVTKERKNGQKIKVWEHKHIVEKRYYISSLLCDILLFSKAIRTHWQVENNLHWQLDYTFKEDQNTTMNKQALFNLQIIKKASLALLNRVKDSYGTSIKLIRQRLAFNFEKEAPILFNSISKL